MLYYNQVETNQNKRKEHNMIKCGLCGKEFEDDQFEEYASHVNKCAADMRLKKDTEEMQKIQNELEDLKRAKVCYEGLRDAFKEKYPDIYKANFPDETVKTRADSTGNKPRSNVKLEGFNKSDFDNIKSYDNLYDLIASVFSS